MQVIMELACVLQYPLWFTVGRSKIVAADKKADGRI